MRVTILNESEIRSCESMDIDALATVADGSSRMSDGEATIPPVLRKDVHLDINCNNNWRINE